MTDRRVLRTRHALQQALIALILEKGYAPTTVKEVAERANVNHATFYLHYKNKEQLLTATLEETFDGLVHELESNERCCIDSKQAMIRVFEHVAAHASSYRVLLSVQGGMNAMVIWTRNYIASVVKRQLTALVPHAIGGIPYDVIAHHTAGALLAVVGWWLDNDMPYPPTVVGEMACRLSAPGTLIGLGLDFQLTALNKAIIPS